MKKSIRLSTSLDTFVDTSGFYSALVTGDEKHTRALKWFRDAASTAGKAVTTDYILAETATLLRAHGRGYVAGKLFDWVFASVACRVVWMEHDRFAETQTFFLKHHDKSWSFTDCFSFIVMRTLGIQDALTRDHHFRQAGFNVLLG